MKGWRPEGWENPHSNLGPGFDLTYTAFEAGADAMLEALKKKGGEGLFKHCKCGHIEEDHAMDAPEGEQECLAEGCECEQFEEEL